jgi:hypothetical protein
MSADTLNSVMSRVSFLIALVLMAMAVLERVLILFGYTILRGAYTPGRLLEFAAMLLVLDIALMLWQVREELRKAQA